MGEMRKVTVELDAAAAEDVDRAVQAGEFADAEAAINGAVALWRKQREAALQRLRALIDEGMSGGESLDGNFDTVEIKRRGRERLAAQARR